MRSALLIISLLAAGCTRHEADVPPEATARAQTAPEPETTPQSAPAPPGPPDGAAGGNPPPAPGRNLLRLPPEYGEAQRLYNEARRALRSGHEDSASDLLDEVLALRPDHAMAVRDRMALCRERGEHDEALIVIDQALAAHPANATFRYERALTQFEMGRSNDALLTLATLLDPEKPFPAARLLQMKALAALGDTEATLAALEAAAAAGFTDTRMVLMEPLLKPLSGDPRFERALESIERTKANRRIQ